MEEQRVSFFDTDMLYLVYRPYGLHGPIKEGMGWHHDPVALCKRGTEAVALAKAVARADGGACIRDAWGEFVCSFEKQGNKVVKSNKKED